MDEPKLDTIAEVIEATWPEAIDADALRDPELWDRIGAARNALLEALSLTELG